jgi:hypothetical protein
MMADASCGEVENGSQQVPASPEVLGLQVDVLDSDDASGVQVFSRHGVASARLDVLRGLRVFPPGVHLSRSSSAECRVRPEFVVPSDEDIEFLLHAVDAVGNEKWASAFGPECAPEALGHGDAAEFFVLDRARPGSDLDVAEESWIRAGGGPTNASNPNGGLSNERHEMNDGEYRSSGVSVPWP